MSRRVAAEELLAFIGQSTGPHTRVRDPSILCSVAARPDHLFMSERIFDSTAERTAALLHAIIRWEPLDMWNTSFCWYAAQFIARTDGADLDMSPLDRMTLTDEIVNRRVDDVPEIAKRLAPFLRTE